MQLFDGFSVVNGERQALFFFSSFTWDDSSINVSKMSEDLQAGITKQVMRNQAVGTVAF